MLLSTELEGVKDFMPNSNHFHWNGYRTELTIHEHLYTCGLFIKKKECFLNVAILPLFFKQAIIAHNKMIGS